MNPRRGRPPKFGRPSRLVALTLPEDVLTWLRTLDPDPARAVVRLHEEGGGKAPGGREPRPTTEIALLAGRRGLIVVERRAFVGLPGVELLPLDGTRAFLALRDGAVLADLELAVADRLEEATDGPEREALAGLRTQLRAWRQDPAWKFESRSIIVGERRRKGRKPTA